MRPSWSPFSAIVASIVALTTAFGAGGARASSFTIDRIERIVASQDVRQPGQLLRLLGAPGADGSAPTPLLAQRALIYRTASPHTATRTHPRVIAFGAAANLILAFNDLPEQIEPFLTFDLLEFNPSTLRYDAAAVRFAPGGLARAFVERNPPSCVDCHSAYLGVQPIRSAYLGRVFPGIFGSLGGALGERATGIERTWLQEFEATTSVTGRYAALPARAMPADGSWDKNEPNAILGRLLNQKHFQSLAPAILADPALAPYRYAMLAALECMSDGRAGPSTGERDLALYVPATRRASFALSFADAVAQGRSARDASFARLLRRRELMTGEPVSPADAALLAPRPDAAPGAVLYLAQNLLGVPRGQPEPALLVDLRQTALDGDDGYGGLRNLAEALYPLVLTRDADAGLRALHRDADAGRARRIDAFEATTAHGAEICAGLKARSLATLAPSAGDAP